MTSSEMEAYRPSLKPFLNAFLTRRSSPEWNDRIATRPPAFSSAAVVLGKCRAIRVRRSPRSAGPETPGARHRPESRSNAALAPPSHSARPRPIRASSSRVCDRGRAEWLAPVSSPAVHRRCPARVAPTRVRSVWTAAPRRAGRAGFIRMSSGPSALNVKPRAGHRSASTTIPDRPATHRLPRCFGFDEASEAGVIHSLHNQALRREAQRRSRASVFGNSIGSQSNASSFPPGCTAASNSWRGRRIPACNRPRCDRAAAQVPSKPRAP